MSTSNCDVFAAKDYKRTRSAYAMECTFEYFVALLVSDAYLSSLLDYIGISDSTIGIISSLVSLAFLFQLFSIFAVKNIKNVKRASILFHFVSQLVFMSLFLVPFLPFAREFKTAIVIGCVLIAYFGNYLVTSMIFKWGMSYVDDKKRASYAATKEMIGLIGGIVFMLAVGYVVDLFAKADNVQGGFIFIASAILFASVCDLVCLLLMKSPEKADDEERGEPISQVIKSLFKNKAFICTLIVGILLYSATYLTSSFMGIYKTSKTELGFTVGEVQIINVLAFLFRFIISKPIGKFSDKTSYSTGLLVGAGMLCLCFFLNIFTTPSSRWMVYLYELLLRGSYAATSQNFLNMTFDYVENKHFVQASSIKAAISGISGFLATLVGAKILSEIQGAGNTAFGIQMRGQQLLSAISFVLSVLLVLFIFFVLRKQKKTEE